MPTKDPAFAVRRMTPPIDYTGVPQKFQPDVLFDREGKFFRGPPRVSAVCHSMAECEDLVNWFGDPEYCPFEPVLLLIPGHPRLMCGLGMAPVAEMRDLAVYIWGKYTLRIAKQGHTMNMTGDEFRERFGMARKEDVTEMTAEAFKERIKKHQASPVTDPFRQPKYPRVNGRTVHPVAESQEWKHD